MMPTAELLVVPVETTRSAACPKQLSTKRSRRKRKRLGIFCSGWLRQVAARAVRLGVQRAGLEGG
jgi:hypothetical protein